MAQRPVNLTNLVILAPPAQLRLLRDTIEKSTMLRHATLACAMFLSRRGYIVMQDQAGSIWVQHKKSPVILQPPGGITLNTSGLSLPISPWLQEIQRAVRFSGRVALDPDIPYVHSAMMQYREYYAVGVSSPLSHPDHPATIVGGEQQGAKAPNSVGPRALNPFLAQRSMSVPPPHCLTPLIWWISYHSLDLRIS